MHQVQHWLPGNGCCWTTPSQHLNQCCLITNNIRWHSFEVTYMCLKFILTHWGRETHICVEKVTIIGSDNGLSPGRRQAIIWTNAGILLIGASGTNFSEILIEIQTFSFKKMHLKMSSGNERPFCLGLNVLTTLTSPGAGECMVPLVLLTGTETSVPSNSSACEATVKKISCGITRDCQKLKSQP